MTEVWFRNPDLYIRELVEVGEHKLVWDRGLIRKKKIDPVRHAEIYFSNAYPWRILTVGSQGTAEYQNGDKFGTPRAVYPTWEYGDDASLLEELIAKPVGEDPGICEMTDVPEDELPVLGQEHRVIICKIPKTRTGPGRAFLRHLRELQEDYPNCKIHLHGLYSYRAMFSFEYAAVDVDARTNAAQGNVDMPSGQRVSWQTAAIHPKWSTVLGFKPRELEVPRNRCMYNIKSAVWCGANFASAIKFKVKGSDVPDTESPTKDFKPAVTKSHMSSPATKEDGDQFICNTCSLSAKCKYFREGAVCAVPGAEPVELARYFTTRDAGQIIDGLGLVMGAGARRLERGYRTEAALEDTFPEVTKMQGQIFDMGTKLAKLLDPNLRGGAKVGISIGGGSAVQINQGNERDAVAAAFRAFELQGIPRENVTTEMIQQLFASMATPEDRQKAIAQAVDVVDAEVEE